MKFQVYFLIVFFVISIQSCKNENRTQAILKTINEQYLRKEFGYKALTNTNSISKINRTWYQNWKKNHSNWSESNKRIVVKIIDQIVKSSDFRGLKIENVENTLFDKSIEVIILEVPEELESKLKSNIFVFENSEETPIPGPTPNPEPAPKPDPNPEPIPNPGDDGGSGKGGNGGDGGNKEDECTLKVDVLHCHFLLLVL